MNLLLTQLKHFGIVYRQFTTFVLVGLVNTIFGYSIFSILIFMQLHYSIAILLSTCLGVIFNFFTTGNIVFKNKNKKLIIQFIAVYAIIYFISLLIFNIAKLAGITNPYLAGALVTTTTPFISFYLNKYYVFATPSLKPSASP